MSIRGRPCTDLIQHMPSRYHAMLSGTASESCPFRPNYRTACLSRRLVPQRTRIMRAWRIHQRAMPRCEAKKRTPRRPNVRSRSLPQRAKGRRREDSGIQRAGSPRSIAGFQVWQTTMVAFCGETSSFEDLDTKEDLLTSIGISCQLGIPASDLRRETTRPSSPMPPCSWSCITGIRGLQAGSLHAHPTYMPEEVSILRYRLLQSERRAIYRGRQGSSSYGLIDGAREPLTQGWSARTLSSSLGWSSWPRASRSALYSLNCFIFLRALPFPAKRASISSRDTPCVSGRTNQTYAAPSTVIAPKNRKVP